MNTRKLHLAATCGALVCAAAAVHADVLRDLVADDPVSEIGVARIADDAGDELLLGALSGEQGRQAALFAARAAPHAAAPEHMWPALARLACGRDPALAPEAAAALARCEARLAPSELAQREVLLDDLRRARATLVCPAATVPARPDITTALARLGARVDAVLVELAGK